jgi:hypothetical protein
VRSPAECVVSATDPTCCETASPDADCPYRSESGYPTKILRCPQLRPDPAQATRLQEIRTNLLDRLREAKKHGWLGKIAAIETSIAAADRKLETMRQISAKHTITHLGMPDFRAVTGRSTSQP